MSSTSCSTEHECASAKVVNGTLDDKVAVYVVVHKVRSLRNVCFLEARCLCGACKELLVQLCVPDTIVTSRKEFKEFVKGLSVGSVLRGDGKVYETKVMKRSVLLDACEVVRQQDIECGVGKYDEIVCKFVRRGLECPQGPLGCPFRHFFHDESEKERVSRSRSVIKSHDMSQPDPDDPFHREEKHSKTLRASIFADWLVEKYGRVEEILDVAGGSGALSYELKTRHELKSVIVDPRSSEKGSVKRRKMGDNLAHLRAPLLGLDEQNEPKVLQALKSCDILVGLHPDQATEPIVDWALKLGKPFAVIPCCVFPLDNPHRKLKDGSPVSSHEEFVKYLCEKDERIQLEFLPFHGKNKIVYMCH